MQNEKADHSDTERLSLIRTLYRDTLGESPDWLETTLLRSGEVALLFQVSRRTVIQWARTGKLPYITTPGGHRRYRARDVRELLDRAGSPRTGGGAEAK